MRDLDLIKIYGWYRGHTLPEWEQEDVDMGCRVWTEYGWPAHSKPNVTSRKVG